MTCRRCGENAVVVFERSELCGHCFTSRSIERFGWKRSLDTAAAHARRVFQQRGRGEQSAAVVDEAQASLVRLLDTCRALDQATRGEPELQGLHAVVTKLREAIGDHAAKLERLMEQVSPPPRH